MNWALWAFKLFSLLPLIANGVHAVHDALPLSGKLGAAEAALQYASAGAISILPAEHQEQATQIAGLASSLLASTVTALHNAAPPVAQSI